MYTREVYEAVGEYDPELFLVEDYDYFMRIAKRFRICHIAEPLYYFRRARRCAVCLALLRSQGFGFPRPIQESPAERDGMSWKRS